MSIISALERPSRRTVSSGLHSKTVKKKKKKRKKKNYPYGGYKKPTLNIRIHVD
jgi:hypothetical protein